MKRSLLIKIHLYLSSFFAPFLILMTITGTLYLFSQKGSVNSKRITTITTDKISESIIKEELSKINPTYRFEYTKSYPDKVITRPTTRKYYEFIKQKSSYEVREVTPSFLKRIIEVHKGHGPKALKWFQKILGICLALIILTGIALSLIGYRHTKISITLMCLGTISLAYLFYFL